MLRVTGSSEQKATEIGGFMHDWERKRGKSSEREHNQPQGGSKHWLTVIEGGKRLA